LTPAKGWSLQIRLINTYNCWLTLAPAALIMGQHSWTYPPAILSAQHHMSWSSLCRLFQLQHIIIATTHDIT
jgi:hypothetical protein